MSEPGGLAIIGEDTARKVEQNFALLEVDFIAVKGKQQAVKIYGLVGDRGVLHSENFCELNRIHTSMLSKFRNREWTTARELLGQLRNSWATA